MPTLTEPHQRLARRLLPLLLVATFGIRLIAIELHKGLATPPPLWTDEYEYDIYAWNVAQGRGYRGPSPDVEDQDHLTAYRPPVTPLVYAGIYRVFGHNYAAAHIFDAVLASMTVLLLYRITLQCFGRGAALLAAFAYAFYPVAIYYGLTLDSESHASFLICLFVWCTLGFKNEHGLRWALAAGVAFGLLLLCKPGYVFLIPLLPVWAWIVSGKQGRLWLRAAVVPVCAGLVIAPWAIRNWYTMGAFIPFGTGGGSLLLQANNRIVIEDPKYYGYAVWDTCLPEYAPALRSANDELKRDALAKEFAVQWLRANPDKWFYLAHGKFLRLWSPSYRGSRYSALEPILSAYYGLMLVFFVASLLPVSQRFLRERHPGIMMQCIIAATVAMALIFHGQHRYRFPIDSLCISIASVGLSWLLRVVAERSYRSAWASVRSYVTQNRALLAIIALTIVGLSFWWKVAQNRIEAYRHQECQRRLEAIREAVLAFRAKQHRLPSSLADLVPDYLPNVGALHCPAHSLNYHDYHLYPSTDAHGARAKDLISYQLILPADPTQEIVIVESWPNHGGAQNQVRLDP